MAKIPLGKTHYLRTAADFPELPVRNRFFENSPLTEEGSALITRPGFRRWLSISSDPINNIYSQPGSFNDSLFVISGQRLYRVLKDETISFTSDPVLNNTFGNNNSVCAKMAATSRIGSVPEYLFIADGVNAWIYAEAAPARGILTATGNPSVGDIVRLGDTYYSFQTVVNSGTPDGSSLNPWRVLLGPTSEASLSNLSKAINDSGVQGVTYNTGLIKNPSATGFNSGTTLRAYSLAFSSAGNSVTTDETSAALSWGLGTLSGGGTPGLSQIIIPDGYRVIDVVFVSQYVVFIVGNGDGVNGRFYWIAPGEVVIDDLAFATAERTADALVGARAVEDELYLFGTNTTEIWYTTGQLGAPFQRLSGKVYNLGVWPGSDAIIKNTPYVVDTEGAVYSLASTAKRVSTPAIEEALRKSFAYQRLNSAVMRSWGFSVDGHDFYILHLPGQQTLVYDAITEEWSSWSSSGSATLHQTSGFVWNTAGLVTYGYSQQFAGVAGDSRTGRLWLIDPALGVDQNLTTGASEPFTSTVIGGIPIEGRNHIPCNFLRLHASRGRPNASGASVTIRISDDEGQTWFTLSPIVITSSDFTQDITWRSLGVMKIPGRLFEVSDNGAFMRIDSLEMS